MGSRIMSHYLHILETQNTTPKNKKMQTSVIFFYIHDKS